MTLNYVTPHLNGICKLFGPEEIKYFQIFDLCALMDDLKPIYKFTTNCEIYNTTQKDVVSYFRRWVGSSQYWTKQEASSSTKLRFSSTADIELVKLCFFTTIAGISEKTKNYPHLPSIFIRDAQNPLNTIINIEVEFLESFNSILEKVCDKLLNDENVIKIFFQ